MSGKKPITLNKIITDALEQIALLQKMQDEHIATCQFINRTTYWRGGEKLDSGNIGDHLRQKENELWRHVFMFGLALPDGERERIKAAAYEKFMEQGKHVAIFFDWGNPMASVMKADEEEFRAMAFDAFCPESVKADIEAARALKALRDGGLEEREENKP